MFKKLIELLEAKFQGTRKDGLTIMAKSLAMSIKTEEEAATLVESLTIDQVNAFITDWRRDADSEITKATETREKSLREKYDFVDKGKPTPPTPPKEEPKSTEMTEERLKSIVAEAVKPFQEKIAAMENSQLTSTRQEAVEAAIKDAPDIYKKTILDSFKNRSFENEDAFNTWLTNTKDDVSKLEQAEAEAGLRGHASPQIMGKVNKEGVSEGVEAFIKETTAENKAVEGKSLI